MDTTMTEYDDEPIFDLRLISGQPEVWIFERDDGATLELAAPHCGAWREDKRVGRRGLAEPVHDQPGKYHFRDYLDQSLRRSPELDCESGYRLGWRCGAKPDGFTCPVWLVPGAGGQLVEDETQPVTINVPPEFFELCEGYGMEVDAVLGAFMADAAGLMNWVRCPRADGLCSNGSDERAMAQGYLERCYNYPKA